MVAGTPEQRQRIILAWAFARLDVAAFATASGAVCAFALFTLTLLIFFKGAPPGIPVGPHLGLLAAYMPGFTVSVPGAAIGAAYAAAIGAFGGLVLAALWNLAHAVLFGVIRMRANLFTYSID